MRKMSAGLGNSFDGSSTGNSKDDNAGAKKPQYDEYLRELETNRSYVRDVNLCRRISLYRIRGELGTGNFSLVKMAIHELTNEKVALKVFMKDKLEPQAFQMALAEIANQSDLEHPHIVRLYEAIQTPTRLYMATEFLGGGELFFKVADEGRLSDGMARTVFRQILDAVAFLHSKLIIHRDLKAENVMFSSTAQCWVKLGDFGFSTRVKSRDEMLTTFCGSPPYAAPELYRDDKYDGFMADVWSLGVLLYFIVTGMLPFRSSNLAELRKLITTGRYRIPEALPAPCRTLIAQLLGQTPASRPSTDDIARSEWLCEVALPSESVSEQLIDHKQKQERQKIAVKMLNEFGIDQQRLDGETDKTVWSPINGCYRIITHRLEKSHTSEPETHDFPFHLYNLGFEPQRYRVSSGDVLAVSNAAVHQQGQQQQQQQQQNGHDVTGSPSKNNNNNQVSDDDDDDDQARASSCLPAPPKPRKNSNGDNKHRSKSSQHGGKSGHHHNHRGHHHHQHTHKNGKQSAVCSIL